MKPVIILFIPLFFVAAHADATVIEFHTDGIIQEGDDFDLVEIFDDATVVMVGGTVRRFQTYETSVLNIWGGVVGGGNKHIVLAYDTSIVNMVGGSFDGGIFLGLDFSIVNISGGSFTGQIGLVDSSQMNVWGGIENTVLGASDSSTVNIYGENFVFTSPGATLTGNWADDTPFSIYIRAGLDRVNLIPEPGTLALFGLGALAVVRKKKRTKLLLYVLVFFCLVFSEVAYSDAPSVRVLQMGSPVSFGEFDAAGYSDGYFWGQSPGHGYQYHEMLSGEWAAAIYYDGIATGNQAMWLTDWFQWPYWTTNSVFSATSCSSWDDPYPPGNPVPPNYNAKDHDENSVTAYDTGQSVIQNGQVRITIDYEMADLGDQGPYSPLSFGSLVGADAFVYSERYVLLQTYTIKNITASSIENLKFYQMLHAHPAEPPGFPEDAIDPVVFSVYDDTAQEDPLEDYVPYNEVHCEEGSIYAGNFRYDITQWNNPHDPAASKGHRDWIGFSSSVAPDFIENGILQRFCRRFLYPEREYGIIARVIRREICARITLLKN